MTKRTLLIDGDMVAYRVAAAEEKPLDFGDHFILSADAENGRQNLESMLDTFYEVLDADRIIITLTAPDNYRKDVLPSYKANRDGVRRPMILGAMREFLEENYETVVVPRLEADDVMGILATHPTKVKGEKIMVTWDKDLRTVPGLHWNPEKDADTGPVEVNEKKADALFYAQVLSGDAVDGYAGCPGIGTKRAADIVRDPVVLVRTEQEIQRGPNKGSIRVRWEAEPTNDIWECIVSHYEKAGLTERDALNAAQVARILRHTDYDFEKKAPILWTPENR